MAEYVYNARGATTARPCPTRPSSWFSYGHCSRDDVQMWRAAAANLYQLGIIPLLEQLERIDATLAAEFRARAELYRTQFQSLPADGSLLSTARNLESVTEIVGIMQSGNQLVLAMQDAVTGRGLAPVEVGLPPPPDPAIAKSPWARLVWPTMLVGGLAAVIGLVAIAARGRADNGKGGADVR